MKIKRELSAHGLMVGITMTQIGHNDTKSIDTNERLLTILHQLVDTTSVGILVDSDCPNVARFIQLVCSQIRVNSINNK